jgi:hypothetical protein
VEQNSRRTQRSWTGIVERPEFVVVRRDHQTFPAILYEWRRRREADGFSRRSARVIYLDDDKILRQSWFLERFVEAAPHSAA